MLSRELFAQKLYDTRTNLHTPQQIINAIKHGSHHWIKETDPHQVKALTRGSMLLGDIFLTVAFTEQYHSIGWHHLYLGYVSTSWEKAYQAYSGQSTTLEAALRWSMALVTSLWEYTRQIWLNRNLQKHGMEEEQAMQAITKQKEKIITLFDNFNNNQHMLLPRHHSLFNQHSLEEQLRQPFDDATCWLRLVEEAIETRTHHDDILRTEAENFFPRNDTTSPPSPSETVSMVSTVSYYSSSLDSSESIDVTNYLPSPTSLTSTSPCASGGATNTCSQRTTTNSNSS
jgi:hypothetical protein